MSKKTIRESTHFKFIQSKHAPPGNANAHPLYIIDARKGWTAASIDMEEVRNIIDPNRNISGKNGTRWKFRKFEDADKLWMYLMLRYS
jgi:hypothetical protein